MKKTALTTALAAAFLITSATAGAATATVTRPISNQASVNDAPGDEEVLYGNAPKYGLDATRLNYRAYDNAVRVVISADDVLKSRAQYREGFSVAIYPNGEEHAYTVHHRAVGGLRVLDFTRPASREYNIPGKFFKNPDDNTATFIIPVKVFGNPETVSFHAGTYLETLKTDSVKTLDFTNEGPRIRLNR